MIHHKIHIFRRFDPLSKRDQADEMDHDIALIILDQGFDFTRYVRPICLPPSGDYQIEPRGTKSRPKCVISGFGNYTIDSGEVGKGQFWSKNFF